jgi:hypothetical protein
MNHCGVLRKMIGFFERHECGYWCFSRPAREQCVAGDQLVHHGFVGVALLALVVDDARARLRDPGQNPARPWCRSRHRRP